MSGKVDVSGTSESLTVDEAAAAFLSSGLLSDEEKERTSETPPAQESPEPVPDEAEASPEQAEEEGEVPETDKPEEQTEESVQEPPLDLKAVKVKKVIDGQEVEITLEEALNGYSRTQDYTRKTQALAEQRKQHEAEYAALRDERQQYATYLVQLEQTIKEATPKEPDWNQLQQETTPAEFGATWAQWQAHKQQMDQLASERAAAEGRVREDQARMFQTKLEEEKSKLLEAIPEWREPEAAKTEKAKLVAFAESAGYTKEEIHQTVDHRALVLLRKAMLWDEAQKNKPAIVQKIQKVTTAPPGPGQKASTPGSKLQRLNERLAKTGDVKDAAALFQALGID